MALTAHPQRLPRALSATALDMYERCPRQFALHYLTDERDDRLPTPQLILGNTVHAALAALLRLQPGERDIDTAHRLLRHHWSSAPRRSVFIHSEEEAAWGRRALALLSRFCSDPQVKVSAFALEEWVRADLPNGRRVCGRVDRADRVAGGLEIVDYKTGSRPDDFRAGDQLAARVYALAGFRTFKRPIVAVRFSWLTTGTDDVWQLESEDLSRIEDELAELTERVTSDRSMAARASDWCVSCPFRGRCPATAPAVELECATDLPF